MCVKQISVHHAWMTKSFHDLAEPRRPLFYLLFMLLACMDRHGSTKAFWTTAKFLPANQKVGVAYFWTTAKLAPANGQLILGRIYGVYWAFFGGYANTREPLEM